VRDNTDEANPRVVELNMLGEVVWEYRIPQELRGYTNPGFDAEALDNGNMLLGFPRYGIMEIDRSGNMIWSYRDTKVTHDADRLANGNTLMVFGGNDTQDDAQVKEVDPQGNLVWQWFARDHFDYAPYDRVWESGWTHTNAATRLANGNTLISLRNFNFLVMVSPDGQVVQTIGQGLIFSPHDPEVLENGNILVASQPPLPGYLEWPDDAEIIEAREINPATNQVVWQYGGIGSSWRGQLTRDANRLANGNTLITGHSKVIEVTPGGEVVWQLELNADLGEGNDKAARGFYKAQRIPAGAN
jgi:hypothetical protein